MNVVPDELLQLAFALDVKVAAYSGEPMVTPFRHFERECLHLGFIDQHLRPPLKLCI